MYFAHLMEGGWGTVPPGKSHGGGAGARSPQESLMEGGWGTVPPGKSHGGGLGAWFPQESLKFRLSQSTPGAFSSILTVLCCIGIVFNLHLISC